MPPETSNEQELLYVLARARDVGRMVYRAAWEVTTLTEDQLRKRGISVEERPGNPGDDAHTKIFQFGSDPLTLIEDPSWGSYLIASRRAKGTGIGFKMTYYMNASPTYNVFRFEVRRPIDNRPHLSHDDYLEFRDLDNDVNYSTSLGRLGRIEARVEQIGKLMGFIQI